jgi:hypothetical protein
MKKCPPGIICIENITMIFFIVTIIIIYFIYLSLYQNKNNKKETKKLDVSFFSNWIPSWPYYNKDIIGNPYVPPLRDERYLINENIFNGISSPLFNGRVPINISTNIGAVDTQYRQLGILTPLNGPSKDNILPLMGRPLFTNRNMWNYFTTSNQHNNVKLPVSRNGKSCTNEYGCDKLYNGDTVYIEGINEPYRITEYDNDTIKYLPFI